MAFAFVRSKLSWGDEGVKILILVLHLLTTLHRPQNSLRRSTIMQAKCLYYAAAITTPSTASTVT